MVDVSHIFRQTTLLEHSPPNQAWNSTKLLTNSKQSLLWPSPSFLLPVHFLLPLASDYSTSLCQYNLDLHCQQFSIRHVTVRHGKKIRTRGYPPKSVPTLTGNTRVDRIWVRVLVFPDNQKSVRVWVWDY